MTNEYNNFLEVETKLNCVCQISFHMLDSYFAIAKYVTVHEREEKKKLLEESIHIRCLGFHETHHLRALDLVRYG